MRFSLLFLSIFFVWPGSNAHSQNVSIEDSLNNNTVIKAMKDEIQRNMEQLREEDYDKPFFIAYNISDLNLSYATSMLGAVIGANEADTRNWYARVIVGGYDINDENFKNSFEGYTFDPGYELLPLDNDYWGIRRALWIATNNIYKSAARNYKQKLVVLEENDQEYLVPDFSKTEPITYFQSSSTTAPDLKKLEILSKSISSEFVNHPEYLNSSVITYSVLAKNHFVNSEGSRMIKPLSLSRINVNITKGSGIASSNGQLTYYNTRFEDLPSEDVVKNDIKKCIDFIGQKDSLKELKDDYSGPILLEGQAVAEFFISNLLNSEKNGIIASREEMVNSSKQDIEKFFKELKEELAEENMKVAISGLTVESLSSLEEFGGIKLIGHYDIDGDCVIPSGQLTLIKDGILVNKINDRVPAPGINHSTGHNRLFISNNDVSKSIAPGVLKVTITDSGIKEDVMEAFESEIDEEDLDFAMVVRPLELTSISKPLMVYQYNPNDKSLILIKANITSFNRKNALKKIIASSDTYQAYNILWTGNSYSMSAGAFSGVPISIIVPTALLLKDFDYYPTDYEEDEEKPIINGPFQP